MKLNLTIAAGKTAGVAMAISMAIASQGALAAASSLTLFHANDGESKLLGSGNFGGLDYFVGELNAARSAAQTSGRDVVTVSSGDNVLAGLAWRSSEARRGDISAPITGNANNYFDALALTAIGFDVITLGNHEFDFGTAVLGDLIDGFTQAGGTAPFVSANLDVSADAALNGKVAPYAIVTGTSGERYGIIGATTETLDTISQPGPNVAINDVATSVQNAVTALEGEGVDKIILSSHLQGIDAEQALVPSLRGVDIIVAGGGSELLLNADDALTTERFGPSITGPYPTVSTAIDQDGKNIPIVTMYGEYRYIGALEVEFDANGDVTSAAGNPILVDPATSTNQATGVVNGIDINADILTPLAADVAALESTVVASTEVALDGRRGYIRNVETNLGNLIADGFVWQAEQIASFTRPVVGFTNGGGIRNDGVFPPGTDLTVADALSTLPFANDLAVLREFSIADLAATLEKAVDGITTPGDRGASGGFLQVSGIAFSYRPEAPAGSRIVSISLTDGTELWNEDDGVVFSGTVDVVTNSFTAAGGDGFDELATYPAINLGVGYGDVLIAYLEEGLGGQVTAAAYPAEATTRIIRRAIGGAQVPALPLAGLLGLGALLAAAGIRRRA